MILLPSWFHTAKVGFVYERVVFPQFDRPPSCCPLHASASSSRETKGKANSFRETESIRMGGQPQTHQSLARAAGFGHAWSSLLSSHWHACHDGSNRTRQFIHHQQKLVLARKREMLPACNCKACSYPSASVRAPSLSRLGRVTFLS